MLTALIQINSGEFSPLEGRMTRKSGLGDLFNSVIRSKDGGTCKPTLQRAKLAGSICCLAPVWSAKTLDLRHQSNTVNCAIPLPPTQTESVRWALGEKDSVGPHKEEQTQILEPTVHYAL